MDKKPTEKFNDACIKIFNFLKMLYAGDVEFKKVIEHFSDGNYDGTSNTHVTLNKYLNAMKIFGIKIKKSNGKYRMLVSPYKIKLDLEDVKSITLLKDAAETLPEGKTKTCFEEFIRSLEIRYDDSAQSYKEIINTTQNLDLSFYHSEMVEQVKKAEEYCQTNQKLEIIYVNEKGEDINIICSPKELIYKRRKPWLKALGNNGSRIYEIQLEDIKSIHQLPSAGKTESIPLTIVYKIKNRLAQNYKIRESERVQTIESDGSRVIVNKDEDLDLLLRRLMRYGKECEVISPKFIKEEIINRINKTLENYQ